MDKKSFYKEAFKNDITGKNYVIPNKLKNASMRICNAYGISGICDPMYIVNIIALELGIGNGKSKFYTLNKKGINERNSNI